MSNKLFNYLHTDIDFKNKLFKYIEDSLELNIILNDRDKKIPCYIISKKLLDYATSNKNIIELLLKNKSLELKDFDNKKILKPLKYIMGDSIINFDKEDEFILKYILIVSMGSSYYNILDMNCLFTSSSEYLSGLSCFIRNLKDCNIFFYYYEKYIKDSKYCEIYKKDFRQEYKFKFMKQRIEYFYKKYYNNLDTPDDKINKFYNLLYLLVNHSYFYWYYIYFLIKYEKNIIHTKFRTEVLNKFLKNNNIREKFKNNLFEATSVLNNKEIKYIEELMLDSSYKIVNDKDNKLSIFSKPIEAFTGIVKSKHNTFLKELEIF